MASLLYARSEFAFYYATQSLFFGGTILGAIAASILLKILRKVIHYYLSAILLIISAILFIAFDLFNVDLIKAAGFLSGLSFGIALLTVIIHGGEISVKYLRGALLSNIQVCLDTSIFIGILIIFLISTNDRYTNTARIIGIIQLIFGIFALPAAFFFVYESPIFLLEANNEQEAVKNLTLLRKEPNSMTYEIHNELENLRTIIKNKSIFNPSEIIPFVKISIYRIIYALGTSVPVNIFMMHYYLIYTGGYSLYFLYVGRFIATLIPVYLIDGFFGRKIVLLISFIGSGIFLIVIHALVASAGILDVDTIQMAGLIAIFYNICLGLGGSAVTHTYMSELFNHSSKAYINALIITLEYIVHFIVINFDYPLIPVGTVQPILLCTGVFQVVAGALAYGRKLILLTSLIGSGIFLMIIQIMASSYMNNNDYMKDLHALEIAGLLTFIYYLFLGFGSSSVTFFLQATPEKSHPP
ncbi:uncharacterized protein LOC129613358 [Condylostylus longicornis]|uniref:uncharacterized protein LOC129613358 n=1 Tax=Condylostylus longicornis TaxID=2530218 RepID=UPI00244E2176|nr:uncharacterized protein LOC129613358 [Condylostylus longicornis]